MEVENQVSFISPMLQNTQFGNVDDETTITFKEDADTPMTIDASAPGDVIELSDDFDFDGYQVVRREFFAHTFEPSSHSQTCLPVSSELPEHAFLIRKEEKAHHCR